MQSHEQRVLDERTELDEKIIKLKSFINTNPMFNKLDKEDQFLLSKQLKQMKDYSFTLSSRINRFKQNPEA